MTQNTISLRPALPQDATELARCVNAAYAEYRGVIDGLPDVSAGIDQDITNNQVWVALEDQQIIGGLVLITQQTHVKLANIAVDPKYRGKGAGRRLLDLADQQATQQGHHILRLNTHKDMLANLAMYRHLGWIETARSGVSVSMEKHIKVDAP